MESTTPKSADPSALTRAAHRRIYGGSSMSPTLRAADVLHVVPCAPESVALGDVVVYEPEEGGDAVVHRVVAMDGQWITTRGDANADADPLPVARDRILGRVVYADGGDGVRPIHGGVRGRVAASVVGASTVVAQVVSRLLHQPYRLLASSGLFRVLRPVLPDVKVVAFQREFGVELRLFLGKTPVALLPATRGRWLIRRPFRLILDSEMLARLVLERDKMTGQRAARSITHRTP